MTDFQLLQDFLHRRSAGSFEALVGRYLPLVYGVALRELRHHHLAEDVTQAVFALLAQKAAAFTPQTSIPGWLFRAARYASANLRKTARRRQHHERAAGALRLSPPADTAPRDAQLLLLDRALHRLPTRQRHLILLRYYRQFSIEEIAATTRLTPAAASKRLQRAVARLRKSLAPYADSALLLTLLAGLAVASTATAEATAATSLACAQGAGVSLTTTALMKGTWNMFIWAKIKIAAMLIVTSATLLTGTTLVVAQLTPAAPPTPSTPAPPPAAAAPNPRAIETLRKLAQRARMEADDYRAAHDAPSMRETVVAQIDRLARVQIALDDAVLRHSQATARLAVLQQTIDHLDPADPSRATAKLDLQKAADDRDTAAQLLTSLKKTHDTLAMEIRTMQNDFDQYQRLDRTAQAYESAALQAEINDIIQSAK